MPKACDLTMQTRCVAETHHAFEEEYQRAQVIVAMHKGGI